MNFNKTILAGRLTGTPELKNGATVKYVDFSIAVNERYKEKEDVHFFNCRAYGKTAETIAKYFDKGRAILIDGRLSNSRWTDDDGNKHSMVRVIVEKFEFVDAKKKEEGEPVEVGAVDIAEYDSMELG